MTSAVNRIVSDPEVRQILREFLAFENANSEGKGFIRPLNTRWKSINEWIRNMVVSGSHIYDATLIGEEISKILKQKQNVICFNCVKQGHL